MEIKNLFFRSRRKLTPEEVALMQLKEQVAYREIVVSKAEEDLDRLTADLLRGLNIPQGSGPKKR